MIQKQTIADYNNVLSLVQTTNPDANIVLIEKDVLDTIMKSKGKTPFGRVKEAISDDVMLLANEDILIDYLENQIKLLKFQRMYWYLSEQDIQVRYNDGNGY